MIAEMLAKFSKLENVTDKHWNKHIYERIDFHPTKSDELDCYVHTKSMSISTQMYFVYDAGRCHIGYINQFLSGDVDEILEPEGGPWDVYVEPSKINKDFFVFKSSQLTSLFVLRLDISLRHFPRRSRAPKVQARERCQRLVV